VVEVEFFQVSAIAIPVLLLALGAASSSLADETRRTHEPRRSLTSLQVYWMLVAGLALVLAAEVTALVTIAAGRPTLAAFVVVIAAMVSMLAGLCSLAVYGRSPLAGTPLSGVDIFLFFFVGFACAAILSLGLLGGQG
jgi:hypothetical protein